MTLQQAISAEFERYLKSCNEASEAKSAELKMKNLRRAHIHHKALQRLRRSI